jgi:hypothetical protein
VLPTIPLRDAHRIEEMEHGVLWNAIVVLSSYFNFVILPFIFSQVLAVFPLIFMYLPPILTVH